MLIFTTDVGNFIKMKRNWNWNSNFDKAYLKFVCKNFDGAELKMQSMKYQDYTGNHQYYKSEHQIG